MEFKEGFLKPLLRREYHPEIFAKIIDAEMKFYGHTYLGTEAERFAAVDKVCDAAKAHLVNKPEEDINLFQFAARRFYE